MHGKFGQFDDIFWRVRLDAVVPYNQQLNRKTVPQQPVSASDHVWLILSDQKSFLNNLTSVASYWTGTSPLNNTSLKSICKTNLSLVSKFLSNLQGGPCLPQAQRFICQRCI